MTNTGVKHDALAGFRKLDADNKRLRALLERLEWAGGIGYEGEPCCPVCKQLEDFRVHKADCELAAELGGS